MIACFFLNKLICGRCILPRLEILQIPLSFSLRPSYMLWFNDQSGLSKIWILTCINLRALLRKWRNWTLLQELISSRNTLFLWPSQLNNKKKTKTKTKQKQTTKNKQQQQQQEQKTNTKQQQKTITLFCFMERFLRYLSVLKVIELSQYRIW